MGQCGGAQKGKRTVCTGGACENVVADKSAAAEAEDKPSKSDEWRAKLEASKAKAKEERLAREQGKSDMYTSDPNRTELFGSSNQSSAGSGASKGKLGDAMALNQKMLSENMKAVDARNDELSIQAQQSGQIADSAGTFASRSRAIRDRFK